MLAATEITAKNIDPQQRWLMRLLPIGFTIFLLNFPAGLFVYWITSNLVTLGQNFVIYNYGPGKKTTDGTKGADSGKSKATDEQARHSGEKQASERSQEEIDKQAAKVAKRKRRKKKK
jgi:YidC/Oxa1 family membrane protein insertase